MPQSVAHLTASDDGSGNSKGRWLTRFATAAAQLPAAHRHPLATHSPPTRHPLFTTTHWVTFPTPFFVGVNYKQAFARLTIPF